MDKVELDMNKLAIMFYHKMKILLITCASFFLIANGSADDNYNQAVKKTINNTKQLVDETYKPILDYLSRVETVDLENSNYEKNMELFETYSDNRPNIGENVKVFSGDRMLLKRTGMVVPCIIPKETWSKTKFGWTFEIRKNRKICRDAIIKGYFGDYAMLKHASIPFSEDEVAPWAIVEEKKGKFKFGVGGAFGANWVKKKAVEGRDFEYTKAFRSVAESFQRSIEYSGRNGSILTFVYSESKDGLARDAFTREFTVDLSEGNMGGFKGAIFEVLEATNFEIAYKIKRHFP